MGFLKNSKHQNFLSRSTDLYWAAGFFKWLNQYYCLYLPVCQNDSILLLSLLPPLDRLLFIRCCCKTFCIGEVQLDFVEAVCAAVWTPSRGCGLSLRVDTVQDYLIKSGIKPCLHSILKISIFFHYNSSKIAKFVHSKPFFSIKNQTNLSEFFSAKNIWLGDQLL